MTVPAPWTRLSTAPADPLADGLALIAAMDLPAPVTLLDRDESAVMLYDFSLGHSRRYVWPDHLLSGGRARWYETRQPVLIVGVCRCDDCTPTADPLNWRHRWMIRLDDTGEFFHVEPEDLAPVRP